MFVDAPFIAAIAEFEHLPIPGGIFELDGTIAAANEAAVRLLARPADQLVGRKAWDFAPGADLIWHDVIASARLADYHGEITIATPEGPRGIHYVVAVRSLEARTVALLFAVEIAPASDDSRQRLDTLGLVAGGIAHDFNNQLVSVLAEATSAREEPGISERMRDALQRIETAAQRMALSTRQLLAYAGRGRFVSELIDPDDLVSGMEEQLQRLVRPEITLSLSIGATRCVVQADRALLREVITNLVANAAEACEASGGAVGVASELVTRGEGATWWHLEVRDDGVGMDVRTMSRIFDPFFTTKPDRHGLGLSAAQGIVRRLGGEIAVDSKPGKGSQFHVRLPTVPDAHVQPITKRFRTPSARSVSLAKLRILVADDEPSVRATIRRLLERRGATVVIAVDGDEAAACLANGTYALVLLDVMMPKLTGYQLLPIARTLQPTAKIMLMSGFTDGGRNGSADDEPDAFLEKPFTAAQMDDAIDAVLVLTGP